MPTDIPNRCAKQYDLINQSLGEMRAYTNQGRYVPTQLLALFQHNIQELAVHCPDEIWTEDTLNMMRRGLNEGLDYADLLGRQVGAIEEYIRTGQGETDIEAADYYTLSAFVSAIGSIMRSKALGIEEWPARLQQVR
jgi:hypothetical protein